MPFPVASGLLEPFAVGIGYQDFVQVTTPAAGANAPFVVESRNWLRVLAAVATLTTDANAANRVLSLDFINARGTTYLRNFAPLVITANTAATVFHWQEQVTTSEWNTNTPVKVPVSSLFLPPATTVQFTLDNKQVGDTLTVLSLTVERFDTGPTGYAIGFTPDPSQTIQEARTAQAIGPKPTERLDFPSEAT